MYLFERLKTYEPLFEVWLADELLGSGSYSEVYKLHHMHDASLLAALKVIPIPKSINELDEIQSTCRESDEIAGRIDALVLKYRQEVGILNQLKDCPNIVRFLSFNVKNHADGPGRDILLQMEYLTPLPKMLGEPVSAVDVLRLGNDMCAALEYLQKHNVIHRDIKPDNIFYSKGSGGYKLGDFGLAKLMEFRAISSERGTPLFNAPEIEAKSVLRQGDIRSDIYSLGLVLYMMLNNNRLPFVEKPGLVSAEEARIRRLRGEPFPLPARAGENTALADAVMRACAYDPDSRFASTLEMKAALESINTPYNLKNIPASAPAPMSAAAPVSAAPPPAADAEQTAADYENKSKRPRKKRKKLAVVAVIVAAVIVVSGVAAYIIWRQIGENRIAVYNNLVLSIAESDGDSAFDEAVRMFPQYPIAYRNQALKQYNTGDFEGAIDTVQSGITAIVSSSNSEPVRREMGDLYRVLGSAYFFMEEYDSAITAYETAKYYCPDDPEIQCDYAIALVRSEGTANIDDAETILYGLTVSEAKPGGGRLELLRGEIAFARGEYEEAADLFHEVFDETDDAAVRDRAVLIWAKACRNYPDSVLAANGLSRYDMLRNEINLLYTANENTPSATFGLLIKEYLADAYVRYRSDGEAAALLAELRRSGNLNYLTWENIGLNYQEMRDFKNAREVYRELLAAYPGDYRPPMRLALLGLEEQNEIRYYMSGELDYSEVKQYYEQAVTCMRDAGLISVPGSEMDKLSDLMTYLDQNGWLSIWHIEEWRAERAWRTDMPDEEWWLG